MKITVVAGARPNFMKIAPIIKAIQKEKNIRYRLVHTGQHYNKSLSDNFFNDLEIITASLYPVINQVRNALVALGLEKIMFTK